MQHELDRKGGHRFEVQYRDPEPNFNRRSVKGMVCKLFDVRDQQYSVALSTCGGGRLFNLVVDDEVVSKKILERGQLQTRTTIIPITKIRGSVIEPATVRLAQQLVGADNCIPALDLISYEPALREVMEYVFGQTFVCTDMSVAKQVTYHKRILTRSITLDGDVLEPEGTLSGGAQAQQTPVLIQVAEIKEFSKRLDAKRAELRKIQDEISKIQNNANQYNNMKRQLDAANYELEAIKQLLAQTSYQQHQKEIEEARTTIGEFWNCTSTNLMSTLDKWPFCLLETLKATIAEKKEEQTVCNAKIKDIEANLKDAKGYRDRQLKEAKDNMQKMKEKSDKSKKEWQKREQVWRLFPCSMVDILILQSSFWFIGSRNVTIGNCGIEREYWEGHRRRSSMWNSNSRAAAEGEFNARYSHTNEQILTNACFCITFAVEWFDDDKCVRVKRNQCIENANQRAKRFNCFKAHWTQEEYGASR